MHSKRILDKIQKKIFNFFYKVNKLNEPSELEKKLINELKKDIKILPDIEINGSEVLEAWNDNRRLLRKMILENDPRNFLNWKVIQNTMFYEPDIKELKYIKKYKNFDILKKAIIESKIGNPKPFYALKCSSGNLIHHAYSLLQCFDNIEDIKDYSRIIEFGGGYGSMCRLCYNLGFNKEYIIFDLEEFNLLQKYFLKSIGLNNIKLNQSKGNNNFVGLINNLQIMENICRKNNGKTLCISTWSISEVSLELRDKIFDIIAPNTYLIVYQNYFNGIDNITYFKKFRLIRNNYKWDDYEISHLKNNRYLIGHKI